MHRHPAYSQRNLSERVERKACQPHVWELELSLEGLKSPTRWLISAGARVTMDILDYEIMSPGLGDTGSKTGRHANGVTSSKNDVLEILVKDHY